MATNHQGMSYQKKTGVAVIGLGRIGSVHVKNLRQSGRVSVKWLIEEDLPKAHHTAQSFETPPKVVLPVEMDKMLMDKNVECVFVCTPTKYHEAHIKAALNHGKDVFCEKPLTDKIETTKECYELAEAKGRTLFCAFNRRFDPSFSTVREKIHSRNSGRLRFLRLSSHDPSLPSMDYIRWSGGILKDSTIHDLDMALWMSRSPASSVYVQGQQFSPEVQSCDDHDLVVVIVTHQNGTVSVIDNGRRCCHGYDQRLEAQCENGHFFVSNRPRHQVTQYGAGELNDCMPRIDQSFSDRYSDAYALEINHFIDLIEGTATPMITKDDTVSVMTLIQAAVESNESGVKVNLP